VKETRFSAGKTATNRDLLEALSDAFRERREASLRSPRLLDTARAP